MELETVGAWVRCASGAWVNMAACDMLEVQTPAGKKPRLVAWNAFQTQTEPHLIAEFADAAEARAAAERLLAALRG